MHACMHACVSKTYLQLHEKRVEKALHADDVDSRSEEIERNDVVRAQAASKSSSRPANREEKKKKKKKKGKKGGNRERSRTGRQIDR